jgi:site-specific recombinase XerD
LFASEKDWVFATSRGTPYGVRNVARRVLKKAADGAGLNDGKRPALRFHDLRHNFASHLIVDLGLDVAPVSRILGHASTTITPTSTPACCAVKSSRRDRHIEPIFLIELFCDHGKLLEIGN